MKHVDYFLLIFFLILSSCISINPNSTKGNKTIISQEIEIQDYIGIEMSVPGQVIYRQTPDNKPYFQISTDENLLSLLDISVDKNTLTIKTANHENISPSQLTIYTNSSQLANIKIAGSADVKLSENVKSEDLHITISGVGKVEADDLYCEKLQLKISGAGNVQLKGAGDLLSCSVSGVGSIYAFDYIAQNVECSVSGSGNVNVYAEEKIDARVSGVGSIRYKGNASQINKKVSGVGSIGYVR